MKALAGRYTTVPKKKKHQEELMKTSRAQVGLESRFTPEFQCQDCANRGPSPSTTRNPLYLLHSQDRRESEAGTPTVCAMTDASYRREARSPVGASGPKPSVP